MWVVVALGAAWGLLPILEPLFSGRVGQTRSVRAMGDIQRFAVAVSMYQYDAGVSPTAGLDAEDEFGFGMRLIERLYPLVAVQVRPSSGQRVYLEARPEDLCVLGLLDPWGRPYRIRPVRQPANEAGASGARGIAIWSVGRNGMDESGHGDDVVHPSFGRP